jgi:hypothetical protein
MLLALANRRAPEHMTIDLREEISEVNEVNQWT